MNNNNKYLLIFLSIIFLFFFETLVWLVESWIYNPYYSHGFLIPLISIFLIWTKKDDIIIPEEKDSSNLGFYILISSLILYIISFFMNIRFLSGIALIISIAGVICFLYGNVALKELSFPISFLIFMIPLPLNDQLAPFFQSISTVCSAVLINMIGISAEYNGYEIHLSNSVFEIALACSGIRSIISLMAIAALFSYLIDGALIAKIIIFLSSVPLALFGNILRITSVLFIADRYGSETAMNFFHSFSSLMLFIVSLTGLFLVGRCFGRLKFKKIL